MHARKSLVQPRRAVAFFRSAPLLVLAALLGSSIARAGVDLAANPARIDFGDHALTETTDTTIVLANTGAIDLEIDNLQLGGADFKDYSILSPLASSLPIVVPASTSINVIIRFAPKATGSRDAFLRVESSVGSFDVPITGKGVGDLSQVSFSLASIDFGKIAPNAEADTVLWLRVGGTGTATVSDLQIANNSGDVDFDAEPANAAVTFPVTLAAGDSLGIRIRFLGHLPEGVKTGGIGMVGDAGSLPSCSLKGEVIWGSADFSLRSIDFGDMYVGEVRDSTVDLINTGEVDIEIGDIEFNSDQFFDLDATPVPLWVKAAQTHTFRIQAAASTPGPAFAQLQTVSRTTIPTFRSVDVTMNVLPMPLRFFAGDTLEATCASGTSLNFLRHIADTVLHRYRITSISVEDSGVQVALPATPLAIDGMAAIDVSYSVNPSTVPARGYFVIDYFSGDQVLYRDTVYVHFSALAASTTLDPLPLTGDVANYGVRTTGVQSATPISTLVVRLYSTNPDRISVIESTIALGPYPGAAMAVNHITGGFEVTITSATPIDLNAASELLRFSERQYITAHDSGRIVAEIESPEWDGCLSFSDATVSLTNDSICQTTLLQQYLATGTVAITESRYVDRNHVVLGVNSSTKLPLDIVLHSTSGETLWRANVVITEGQNTVPVDLSSLPAGAYIGTLSSGGRPLGTFGIVR